MNLGFSSTWFVYFPVLVGLTYLVSLAFERYLVSERYEKLS